MKKPFLPDDTKWSSLWGYEWLIKPSEYTFIKNTALGLSELIMHSDCNYQKHESAP